MRQWTRAGDSSGARCGVRHLVMLSVGGTIASGFLLFAGSAIGIAGPAVIVSYVIAGIITIAVMACSNVMEITPPLVMTDAEVDEGIAILDRAIGEVQAGEVSDEVLGDYAGW